MLTMTARTTGLWALFMASTANALSFRTDAVGSRDLSSEVIRLADRTTVPYGPDRHTLPTQDPADQPWDGIAFGAGATEVFAYDYRERYVYSKSDVGNFIAVLDYGTLPATVSEYSLDLSDYDGIVMDVEVCPVEGLVFFLLDGADEDRLLIFRAVKRSNPVIPTLLHNVEVGFNPSKMAVNRVCSRIAVSNRNTPDSIRANNGSVHFVANFQGQTAPNVTSVTFSGFSDEDLVQAAVHMPADRNSMQYWRSRVAGLDTNFWDSVLEGYDPAMILLPEHIIFSDSGDELYVNLPDNSGFLRVNVETARVINAEGYGHKSFRDPQGEGIDLDSRPNQGCETYESTDKFMTNDCLHMLRAPDDIVTVNVDGSDYLITAEEGSDFSFDAFGEKFQAGAIFDGIAWGLANFTSAAAFFEPGRPTLGCAANFNRLCNPSTVEGGWCAPDLEISIGSTAVDYENPSAPVMSRIVGFGGRGIGIFQVGVGQEEPSTLIWDSKSQFEVETCKNFPWAQNAITDETFVSPKDVAYNLFPSRQIEYNAQNDLEGLGCPDANGQGAPCAMGQTTGRQALSDGMALGSVVVGVACDRLVTVACGEANSLCFVYDITTITQPVFRKVFSLTPAAETLNPDGLGQAGESGDFTPETMVFVDRQNSPSGKEGVMIGGATTGTLAFYEFVCEGDNTGVNTPKPTFAPLQPSPPVRAPTPSQPTTPSTSINDFGDESDLEAGVILGIAFGTLFGVLLLGCACVCASSLSSKGLSATEDPTALAEPPADLNLAETTEASSEPAPAEIVPEEGAQEPAPIEPAPVDSNDGNMMDVAMGEDRMV